MGVVIRQSIKTMAVTAAGAALGALTIYLSRYAPAQEFGFSRDLTSRTVVVSQLAMAGMHQMLAVYLYRFAARGKDLRVLSGLTLLTPLVMLALFCLPYFALKDWVVEHYQIKDRPFIDRFYAWLPLYTLLFSYLLILEAYLTARMKVALGAFFREVLLRLLLLGILVAFAAGKISAEVFIGGTVLLHLVPLAALVWFALRRGGLGVSFGWKALSRTDYKAVADFAFFHLLINIAVSLLNNLDVLLLAPLGQTGLDAVAVYVVALFIASVFQIPQRAAASAATPMLTAAHEAGDEEKVRNLYGRTSINMLVINIGMALLIGCNLHLIPAVMGSRYAAVPALALILMLGRAIDLSTGLSSELMSLGRFYRHNFGLTLFIIVVMALSCRLAIPRYNAAGAAWSATGALAVFNILKAIFLWKQMRLNPLMPGTLLLVAGGVAIGLLVYFIPYGLPLFWDITLRTTLIIGLYGGLLLLLKPSPDLQAYLASIRKTRRLF